LGGHHHLLLLTSVGVWSLALVDQVEQVGLVSGGVLVANSARGSDSVVADARGSGTESTRATCVTVMLSHHGHIICLTLGRKVGHRCCSMASIALPQLGHEVSIEHSLAHLNLLVGGDFVGPAVVAARAEATHSRLVEDLVLVGLAVDGR